MAKTRRHIREKRKRLRRLGAFLVALVTLLLCVLLAPEIIRRPRLLEHANEGEPAIALAAEPGDDLASLDSIEGRAHDTVVDHVVDLSDGTSPGAELENGGAPLTGAGIDVGAMLTELAAHQLADALGRGIPGQASASAGENVEDVGSGAFSRGAAGAGGVSGGSPGTSFSSGPSSKSSLGGGTAGSNGPTEAVNPGENGHGSGPPGHANGSGAGGGTERGDSGTAGNSTGGTTIAGGVGDNGHATGNGNGPLIFGPDLAHDSTSGSDDQPPISGRNMLSTTLSNHATTVNAPEPTTLLMLGSGLVLFSRALRRRRG